MFMNVNYNSLAATAARNLNAHYTRLGASIQRLSSGLRINPAADDAAGLAIRELRRADIAATQQGARNANDAISMIQVADGALEIIDEKLIRLKELAEQAGTGTYDSTQRLMIDSEFQAMANEIDRVANATDFNGIHLLDGSLNGAHDGSKLNSAGKMKIHFGTANDSAEDYYYIEVGDCSAKGLGLRETSIEISSTDKPPVVLIEMAGATLHGYSQSGVGSGVIPIGVIRKGSKNVSIIVDGIIGAEDDIQLFTRAGVHLSGTKLDAANNDYTWEKNNINEPDDFAAILTPVHGFDDDAKYQIIENDPDAKLSGDFNDGDIDDKNANTWGLEKFRITGVVNSEGERMEISYSGDYDRLDENPNDGDIRVSGKTQEKVVINDVIEDILIVVSGTGIFDIEAKWDIMPPNKLPDNPVGYVTKYGDLISIKTQAKAQEALGRIDEAIVKKDKIRASLGALQNRLENTVTNLNIQAENLQAAESRISDVDVGKEMTEFTCDQILTQSATAMLSQANSLPQMAMSLVGG